MVQATLKAGQSGNGYKRARDTATSTYHLGGNNYSFDALQAYCFGINIKL